MFLHVCDTVKSKLNFGKFIFLCSGCSRAGSPLAATVATSALCPTNLRILEHSYDLRVYIRAVKLLTNQRYSATIKIIFGFRYTSTFQIGLHPCVVCECLSSLASCMTEVSVVPITSSQTSSLHIIVYVLLPQTPVSTPLPSSWSNPI